MIVATNIHIQLVGGWRNLNEVVYRIDNGLSIQVFRNSAKTPVMGKIKSRFDSIAIW